jgi:hypothetical protein
VTRSGAARRTGCLATAAAIALLLGAGVASAPASSAGVVLKKRSRGGVAKRALVVGDSLAAGTKPYLVRALRGWRVAHSLAISKHAPEGATEIARRGGLPPVIIASLGTNDDPRDVGGFDHAVHTVLQAAGGRRCVIWPNIVRPPVGGAGYAGYNNVLDHLAATHDNLRVVNWVGMADHNRGWFGDDGVHPNATGYTARARAIASAARRCRVSLAE